MEWQPIETAPKDGTDILAYIPNWGCEVLVWERAVGEWSVNGTNDVFTEPTHWMPLPPPPTMTGSREEAV